MGLRIFERLGFLSLVVEADSVECLEDGLELEVEGLEEEVEEADIPEGFEDNNAVGLSMRRSSLQCSQ